MVDTHLTSHGHSHMQVTTLLTHAQNSLEKWENHLPWQLTCIRSTALLCPTLYNMGYVLGFSSPLELRSARPKTWNIKAEITHNYILLSYRTQNLHSDSKIHFTFRQALSKRSAFEN
jgi:hypothetical protein